MILQEKIGFSDLSSRLRFLIRPKLNNFVEIAKLNQHEFLEITYARRYYQFNHAYFSGNSFRKRQYHIYFH
jgi:hypothetical protein